MYYPAFINVKNRICLVIGGGKFAEEKVFKLLSLGAKIKIISPDITQEIKDVLNKKEITWIKRKYIYGDLEDVFIAISATGDEIANEEVFKEAEKRNVLLNIVDVTHLCTFIAPSVAKRGGVTVATSTGGASPALARKFRETLEKGCECRLLEYGDLTLILSEVRNEVRSKNIYVSAERWQECIDEKLLDLVQNGEISEAKNRLLLGLIENK
ncbi:MAG: siroheme synthase [Chloroflexi bacterium]|nr:siroheme synthase [Chloroflexota bacterium]|tara:strand:- start:50240 stop:50875 length:636 start_codon:yes stop_codon:yes gene_type:complete